MCGPSGYLRPVLQCFQTFQKKWKSWLVCEIASFSNIGSNYLGNAQWAKSHVCLWPTVSDSWTRGSLGFFPLFWPTAALTSAHIYAWLVLKWGQLIILAQYDPQGQVLFLWSFRTMSFSLGKIAKCFSLGKIFSSAAPMPTRPPIPLHPNTALFPHASLCYTSLQPVVSCDLNWIKPLRSRLFPRVWSFSNFLFSFIKKPIMLSN